MVPHCPPTALPHHGRTVDHERPGRRIDLDWLKGLMLILMTVTHLPTVFSARFGQPFGFVSAAEGFVFLSAFLVGSVYSRMARERGYEAMRNALLGRAAKVYAVHAGLLLFLFLVLVPLAGSRSAHALTDLASFYLRDPDAALLGGLTLVYNPPLLDILPMYVVFLALSPWVLGLSARRGWTRCFTVGMALWVFAQFDGGRFVYAQIATALDLRGDYTQTGAFALLAWQLLWLAGLWAGQYSVQRRLPALSTRGPSGWLLAATAVAAVLFVWRHVTGQVPSDANATLNALFDKWHLGPLRLLNFAALAVLAMHGREVLTAWARDSSLVQMGRASLAVFCAHLVVCLTLLATVPDGAAPRPGTIDAAVLAGTLVTLYAVARVALRRSKAGTKDVRPSPVAIPGTAR